MKKINITINMITELRSYGANKFEKEFRIPELKSLIRTTYREFFPSENIKEEEDKLFGSTNIKSPVKFKLQEKPINKGGNIISVNLLMITDDRNADFYKKLMILSSITGAIGSKSRHGSGSFFTNIEYKVDYSTKSLGEYLKSLINDINKEVECSLDKPNSNYEKLNLTRHLNLPFPYLKCVHILKVKKNSKQARLGDILEKNYKEQIQSIIKDFKDEFGDEFIKYKNNHKILNTTKIQRFASPMGGSLYRYNNEEYIIFKELNYNYIFDYLLAKNKKGKYFYDEKLQEINKPLYDAINSAIAKKNKSNSKSIQSKIDKNNPLYIALKDYYK